MASRACERFHARQHDVVLCGDLRLPARFNDDGLVRLDDQRGTLDLVARASGRFAGEEACVMPGAIGEDLAGLGRRGASLVQGGIGSAMPDPPPTDSTSSASTTMGLFS
jgi:hypothetical protein